MVISQKPVDFQWGHIGDLIAISGTHSIYTLKLFLRHFKNVNFKSIHHFHNYYYLFLNRQLSLKILNKLKQ